MLARKNDLFIFLGDNIYGDTRDMSVLSAKYAKFAAIPGVARLRATTPVVAIWDDHDFGENDAGGDYPVKEQSRKSSSISGRSLPIRRAASATAFMRPMSSARPASACR